MLKVYEFTVTLRGQGYSQDEAWQEAVDMFVADPGSVPDSPKLIEILEL